VTPPLPSVKPLSDKKSYGSVASQMLQLMAIYFPGIWSVWRARVGSRFCMKSISARRERNGKVHGWRFAIQQGSAIAGTISDTHSCRGLQRIQPSPSRLLALAGHVSKSMSVDSESESPQIPPHSLPDTEKAKCAIIEKSLN
jgi:hypothetical protein